MADIYPKPPSILQSISEFDEWSKNVTSIQDFKAHLAEKAEDSTKDPHGTYTEFAQRAVNVKWFGAKGNAVWSENFGSIPSGTDDTVAIQNAVTFCVANGLTLYIPKGNYLITDTILVNGKLSILAENGAKIYAKIYDKSKPAFKASGNVRGRWENLTIMGTGYLPLAGIQFTAPDNQAMELRNVKAVTCRHGIYVAEAECINRIRFVNCDFTSNLIAGVWIKSYDTTYAQSGPIFFEDTILNGNGIPTWVDGTTQYDGVTVLEPTDKYGLQIYVKGFVNLYFRGGQIDAHGNPKNLALALFESGNGLTMIGTDIEDIRNPVKEDGTPLTDFNASLTYREGGAVTIASVTSVHLKLPHPWAINTRSFVKLAYACEDVYFDIPYISSVYTCLYSCEVFGANTGLNSNVLRLHANGDLSKLNDKAILCLDKGNLSLLMNVDGGDRNLSPVNGINWLFDNYYLTSDKAKYAFYYWNDPNNPDFSKGCWIERYVHNATTVIAILDCTQSTFTPDGVFFIEALDASGGRLGWSYTTTSGESDYNGKYLKAFVYNLPNGTVKIRFGVINTANYKGYIPDHATIRGFAIYTYYRQTLMSVLGVDNLYYETTAHALNKNMGYAPAPPTYGIYQQGFIVWNTAPAAGGYIGWVCTESGKAHLPSTGDITLDSTTITNITNISTWSVGDVIKGAGIPAGTTVTAVDNVNNALTISKAATATATGVSLYDAVFKPFGAISA